MQTARTSTECRSTERHSFEKPPKFETFVYYDKCSAKGVLQHNALVFCKQYLCWQQLKVTKLVEPGGGMFDQQRFFYSAWSEFNVE